MAFLQHPIDGRMPLGVVDPFEVIDVQHQDRQRLIMSAGGLAYLEQLLVGMAAIEDSRQPVDPTERVELRVAHA